MKNGPIEGVREEVGYGDAMNFKGFWRPKVSSSARYVLAELTKVQEHNI